MKRKVRIGRRRRNRRGGGKGFRRRKSWRRTRQSRIGAKQG